MSAAPKVSFLIPCYNLGRYLDETVDSVLAQTFQDFEIIVVDDGSTDDETQRLLAAYRRPKTRVVISPHNLGLAGARNLALSHARGELISALDADDLLDPRFLEKTLAAMAEDPGLTFCSCWIQMFGEEAWVWRPQRCDLPALLAECTVCTAALVRRAAVVAVGGYDETMPAQGYEDWALWLSLVERGSAGRILPEALHFYRRRQGSMSYGCSTGETHLELFAYLAGKHRESYERHLFEVLALREEEAAALLRGNYAVERELSTLLEPQLAALAAERDRLRARRTAAERGEFGATGTAWGPAAAPERAEVERALTAARAEVSALRNSLSWRLTAPLRAAYELLRPGGRPPAAPPHAGGPDNGADAHERR